MSTNIREHGRQLLLGHPLDQLAQLISLRTHTHGLSRHPPSGGPNGVVVLDAAFFDHVVRWYPARFRLPGEHHDDAVVVPQWGEPVRHDNAALPAPVVQLLETWREVRGGDVAAELARLESAGFVTSWRSNRDGVGQPVRR